MAAIEERSLARAAEREGLVTSAVSKRITELERGLGTTVLQRHNRGVLPTPAGSALYYRAKAILGQMAGLTSFVEDFASDGSPKIQLAANRSAIILFLPRELKLYQERQSQRLRVDLLEAYSSDIPRLVVEKNLDLGIYHAVGPAPGVHSLPYHRDRVVLVVPNGHPLQRESAVHLDQAREFDLLGYFPRHSFESFMELAGHSLTGPLNVKIQVSNYEARCKMIREGLGIGIRPRWCSRMAGRCASSTCACAIRKSCVHPAAAFSTFSRSRRRCRTPEPSAKASSNASCQAERRFPGPARGLRAMAPKTPP
ncbi:MAG: LysR family transcriptional regulator [Pollutimonas bauzanensis]